MRNPEEQTMRKKHERLLRIHEAGKPIPVRGVIRIKKGYNPNSSSIGTVVYSFPFAFAALSLILAVLSVLVKRGSKDE